MIIILIGIVLTGLIYIYSYGISGNDFWWHIKAGEWMIQNKTFPSIDVFSWYAKENGIKWISHEWLSEIVLYFIHLKTGLVGIFIFSLLSAIIISILIISRNIQSIKNSIVISTVYIVPIVFLFKMFFYGRPQLISFFLLYATLFCLYRFNQNQHSRSIYYVPIISMLWGNFHGGSSTLPYILCFIFMFSGLFEFSFGKITGEKFPRKKLCTYFLIGIISILALAINPQGLNMLTYPYTNIGDSFMQNIIIEWWAPDIKQIYQLIVFFLPLFVVCVSLIITDKKIKLVDLLIFLFFTYMFFRSVRFSVIFYIASTFFAFDYLIPIKMGTLKKTNNNKLIYSVLILLFIGINSFSIFNGFKTYQEGKLITMALDTKFVNLIKEDAPSRLFNDYNFGETLIYNNIETFVDAREDLFASNNLQDAMSLTNLKYMGTSKEKGILNPEKIIDKYDFDAFLIPPNRSLATYLNSKPEKYKILMEDENAVYFKRIN